MDECEEKNQDQKKFRLLAIHKRKEEGKEVIPLNFETECDDLETIFGVLRSLDFKKGTYTFILQVNE